MSILSILNQGTLGMAANQAASQVTSQNITNAAAEGYVRRAAETRIQNGSNGQATVRRVVDPFVEKRLLNAHSSNGQASAERLALDPLDVAFAESEGGLGSALDAFMASLQELANRPSDLAMREQVLGRAGQLQAAFGNVAATISEARTDANLRIENGVAEVNTRVQQIGALGREIVALEVGGQEASELRDQRDGLLRELSERVPVSVIEHAGGGVSVLLGGSQSLVSADGSVSELATVRDTSGNVQVTKVSAGQTMDVSNLIGSGAIGGLLRARDGALSDMATQVDRLAYDVTEAYNAVHVGGVGLDGVGGRNLFEPQGQISGAAAAFAVSADVAGNPEALATASDASSLPGGNQVALDLAGLASAPLALGGQTVSEALASLVGRAGMAVQTASQAESFASGALTQISTLHDSISGVSTDEEMVALMRFQRAYEASIRVIQVADEMFSQLLELKR